MEIESLVPTWQNVEIDMAVLPGALRDGEVGEFQLELGLDETHPVLPHIKQHVAYVDWPGTLFCDLNGDEELIVKIMRISMADGCYW